MNRSLAIFCPFHLSFSGILKGSEQHKSAVANLHSLENRPYGFFVHSWVDGSKHWEHPKPASRGELSNREVF
jgi:hypothetical protein